MTHHDVECQNCGNRGYVLWSEAQRLMLCAMCHHGGPKRTPTAIRTVIEKPERRAGQEKEIVI